LLKAVVGVGEETEAKAATVDVVVKAEMEVTGVQGGTVALEKTEVGYTNFKTNFKMPFLI
jgi:hypothetical protein